MTPLVPLESFRKILGYSPYHFWGLSNSELMPVRQSCPAVLKEYSWQESDATGRYDIEIALAEAETLLQTYLGYNVAPKYSEVTMPWPRYYDNTRSRIGTWDATGRYIAPRLPFGNGYVQALGTELLTLAGTASVAGGSLVFTNQFNGATPLDDTFTITIATTETDPTKLAVYFIQADRPDGAPLSAQWRVEPVQVTIAAGVATIIGRIWLIVRPILYESAYLQPLDPSDLTAAGPYAQSLLVYSRTTDPTGTLYNTAQATLIWETNPVHGWWCGCGCQSGSIYAPGAINDPAGLGYAAGRGVIRDAVVGVIGLDGAVYNQAAGDWQAVPWADCHEPDSLTVRILAGYPLENGLVAEKYQRAVVHLALSQLARPICACEQVNLAVEYYQQDLARSSGSSELFAFIGREDLSNPLGTRRGAVLAWKTIKNTRLTPGVVGY